LLRYYPRGAVWTRLGGGVDTAGGGVVAAEDGVAGTGDGAAAEAASPLNFSCMAIMASLTPAGVMPWAAAISVYVLPSR